MNKYLLVAPLVFALPQAASAQPPAAAAPAAAAPTTPAPVAAAAPAATAPSEDETVIEVTSTKNPRPLAETTAAITVISRAQIEAKKAYDVTDLLRMVPSLNLAQTGSRGHQTSVFLRGAGPSQTLVLIDGVRVNSPSFGAFDFGTLSTDNIERIEVLRGPQSGLYGSDAIGGVINIITQRGAGPLKTGAKLELGNDGLNRQNFVARGEAGKTGIAFSASRLDSDGIRANDDYRNLATSLRLDRALSKSVNLAITTRYDRAKLGILGQTFGVDPNERGGSRTFFNTVQFTHDAKRRKDKVTFGYFDKNLTDDDPINPGDGFFGNTQTRDHVRTFEAQSAFSLGAHVLTVGAELRRQQASVVGANNFATTNYSAGTTTKAAFLQDEFKSGKNSLAISGRYEDNSQYGDDTNGRVSYAREILSGTRLKAAIGTGFQAPTVDQLRSPFGGNPNLKPVENTTYEVGVQHDLPRGGSVELTAYRTRYKNLIGFDAFFNGVNVDNARGDGLEVSLNQPFGNGFRALANAGLLNINSSAQRNILRRPKYTATADLQYRKGKADFDFGVISRGRGYDVGETGAQIFGGYTRFDLSAGYTLRGDTKIYARINNLFDASYEEVVGYPAAGRQFVVGLQTGLF